ncbi:DNA-binding transcriptional repressor CitR [Klebsiella sp. I138]|uniref:DNA-binding transcriptional repressor CitR n=1 Tax=Klebsiella sp. I138 TaxID=2755385 RepID=UPI003DA9EEC5
MANLYGLKKFDLNLLVVFECIYQHLSISRAAETLFITPSAVSQSLQRLRNQINDPLFIRSGKGIIPTKTGINLHYLLERNLCQIEQTINIASHTRLRKNVVIYSPQLFITPESSRLMNALYQDPNMQVEHHDLQLTSGSIESLLSHRKADLILSLSPYESPETLCQPFQAVEMALVCRACHPRAADLNAREAITRERFTGYLSNEVGIKDFHAHMKKWIPERMIAFRSDSLMAIINMINQTDLIGFIPKALINHPLFTLNVRILPVPAPSIMIYMVYHRAQMNTSLFSSLFEKIIKPQQQINN